ncbi:MAG: DUF2330 domain-containing protein [Pseudomonadota bacterium]|nr:DUF2330 domain-containing protein [Pseudomonadota bacterium]
MRVLIAITVTVFFHTSVWGFCGFYVAKAGAELFNQASQVVLVRQEDKTVLTMANDFKGDPKEFAIVIPVATFIERQQIHIGDKKIIDHLDAYTAPRLVEYYDDNPCGPKMVFEAAPAEVASSVDKVQAKTRGVTVEAEYTVGEYDIVILSAQESQGLETWLTENGYQIPSGASDILGSYIKQNLRFFVAKVNLEQHSKLGFSYLRPIQVAYNSIKFMLPIRLGTVNAQGPQDLLIYTLTQKGRVETTNYRTVKLPSNVDLPVYIKAHFAEFYRALFAHQVEEHNMETVFLEYAWDMNWCDPCAADPLSTQELRDLGVFWLQTNDAQSRLRPQGQNVFVTRLHVRYTATQFPEDLMFQETGNRENFQGRYILRHPWRGQARCPEAETYQQQLEQRQRQAAQNLATLTGWELNNIYDKMQLPTSTDKPTKKWWQTIWE